MSGLGGFVAGVMGLSLLEIGTSSAAAASRVGTLGRLAGGVVTAWINPTAPLIPNLANTKCGTGNSGAAQDSAPKVGVGPGDALGEILQMLGLPTDQPGSSKTTVISPNFPTVTAAPQTGKKQST